MWWGLAIVWAMCTVRCRVLSYSWATMYKQVIIWCGVMCCMGSVWAASSTICPSQYLWGWCCGDGQVNGPDAGTSRGEECDNKALNVSFSNSEARWGGMVCTQNCSIDTSAAGADWSTLSCGGAGSFKYRIEHNLFCNSESSRLSRRLFDYNTEEEIPFRVMNEFGQLVYNTTYNSCGFGEPIYSAMCWGTSSCSAPNSCGSAWSCYAPTICCDGSSQCNAWSCPADNNGGDAGCGTPPPSCGGSIPTNASACNNTSPGSATNWDIVSDCTNAGACMYQCVSPAVPSGTACVVENFTQYVCQSNGNRQANASHQLFQLLGSWRLIQ